MKLRLLSLIVLITISFGVNAQTISTVVGTGIKGYSGDNGLAINANISLGEIAIDNQDNIYISGSYRIRKVDHNTGIISTVVGTGKKGSSGDGGLAINAGFADSAIHFALDKSGNIFISDSFTIRKTDASTGIIQTIAGNGRAKDSGDGGLAKNACIVATYLTLDKFENIYVSCGSRVRRIDGITDTIITLIGTGIAYWLPGGSNPRSIGYPMSLTVDNKGNLIFFSSGDGHTVTINSNTGAYVNVIGYNLCENGFVGCNANNNYYISGGVNQCNLNSLNQIFIYDTTTKKNVLICGSTSYGYSGDGGLAINATLNNPQLPFFDSKGNLYFYDQSNYRVRKITFPPKPSPSLSIDLKDTTSCSFTVDVPVRGKNLINVSKLNGSIGWDTTYLNFGGIKFAGSGIVLDSSKIDFTNVANGKMTYNWSDTIGHTATDSTPVFTITFYPKNNFSGGTGVWFDSIPTKLEIDTAIGVAATKATFNNGWVLLSDTPTVVQVGTILQCFAGCSPIHYQWYENGNPITGDTLNYITPISGGSYTCTVTYISGARVSSLPLNVVLPVTIITFKASPTPPKEGLSEQVLLNWITASEINTSHFNIQRSADGISFTTIGNVNAKGAGAYTFNDPITTQDSRFTKLYYRLQIVDKDGSKTYSEIRSVILTNDDSRFTVSPNPAKSYVTITGNNIKQVSLLDLTGRTVINKAMNTNTINLSINNLSKGIYLVKAILADGSIKTEKLVVE